MRPYRLHISRTCFATSARVLDGRVYDEWTAKRCLPDTALALPHQLLHPPDNLTRSLFLSLNRRSHRAREHEFSVERRHLALEWDRVKRLRVLLKDRGTDRQCAERPEWVSGMTIIFHSNAHEVLGIAEVKLVLKAIPHSTGDLRRWGATVDYRVGPSVRVPRRRGHPVVNRPAPLSV
jgi:hypothetical protein